ncbi:hypothetical protein Lpp125_15785, partial [Lacticaseibacillus paracasei subsp. paracasei Lpp125]
KIKSLIKKGALAQFETCASEHIYKEMSIMTNEHKVLRGLSYISVIFAPILFPILVWIFTPQGSVTRDTAKHALWLHIIPTLLSIFIFMIIGGVGFFTNSINATSAVSLILLLVAMVVDIGMVVYNIYTGIKIITS